MKTDKHARLYYYRPIAALPGVFKCAGFGAEDPKHREFYIPHFTKTADESSGLAAGAPLVMPYAGDRITADGKLFNP